MQVKNFYGFVLFLLAMSMVACGGKAVIDGTENIGSVEMPPILEGDGMTVETPMDDPPGLQNPEELPEELPEEEMEGNEFCTPKLYLNYLEHASWSASPGELEVPMLYFKLTAASCGKDILITRLSFQLTTPDADGEDHTPYCKAPCGYDPYDWNFFNPQVMNPGAQVELPPTNFVQVASNALARAIFETPLIIPDGTSRTLVFMMSIVDPLNTPIQGMRFRAWIPGVTTDLIGEGSDSFAVLEVVHDAPVTYLTIE